MRVGKIEIPAYKFPLNIDEELSRYIKESEDSLAYLAEVGIDYHTENLKIDKKVLQLYAAICYYTENPTLGWAAINIAIAFDRIGELDYAIDVLDSIDNAESIFLYSERYEDPMFLAGFWLADNKRYDDALLYYHKSLKKKYIKEKASIYLHIGTVYHEKGIYNEATKIYKKAISEYKKNNTNSKIISEQIEGANALLAGAQQNEGLIGYCRTNHGIQKK